MTKWRLIRPLMGALHLGEFDIEPCRFDCGARCLDGLLGLTLVGGPGVHFFLRDGARFDQLLGPGIILLGTLVPSDGSALMWPWRGSIRPDTASGQSRRSKAPFFTMAPSVKCTDCK